MKYDIFNALSADITSDRDSSGVPTSTLFWDEVFSHVVEAYSLGIVPGGQHLEMLNTGEKRAGAIPVSSHGIHVSPTPTGPDGVRLIGNRTDSDLTITPMSLQVAAKDNAFAIPIWVATTRGGQRWARVGGGQRQQLVNLADEQFADELLFLADTLDFISRMQQRHMGLELPAPEITPLDMITSIAVSQAAHVAGQVSVGDHRDFLTANAWRAMQAQTTMRLASLRALLNLSPVFDTGEFPIEALIRLDAMNDRVCHTGCGKPNHSSRILSPGATVTLHEALTRLSDLQWDDIDAGDLQILTGMPEEESRWWGPRGIALVSQHNTGGVRRSWASLSENVGPFLKALVNDAARTGLTGPLHA